MTFDEVMKRYNGEWSEDGFAVIQYLDGYYWRIAQKEGGKVVLTMDGHRILNTTNPADALTNKVESTKKREKKPAAPSVDDLDL